MTFAEYYNALYPYLSDGAKRIEFYDRMIGHFIYEEAQEACELLSCKLDTKRRYIKEKNPNKIKPEYAQYAYSKHNPQGYREWLNTRMFEQDTYDRIEEWLTGNSITFTDICTACDDLLETIFFHIAYPENKEGDTISLPPAEVSDENAETPQVSENDRILLGDFGSDYDEIIKKCISTDQSDVLFAAGISGKTGRLFNNKWRGKIGKFDDIRLQSDILSTIVTLQEFCNALDPDVEPVSGTSVRKLRIKLRNCYVKIHPDAYADIYPYEAFIDDWNDGEEYFDM